MDGVASLVVAIVAGAQIALVIYVVMLMRRIAAALASIANSLWAIGKSLENSTEREKSHEKSS
ncbi:hypothetical protein [Aurantiacibacter sp. MUD61]|uniref:hypothetical protein n=1 Tax=Aurantiacibacter sp. MUD61 TaxID=3009083 RepID=UPI0022F06685|nr:hypothetical protein [Aurantiacibacter sp. MUD61]